MPAVTVADTLALPKVAEPDAGGHDAPGAQRDRRARRASRARGSRCAAPSPACRMADLDPFIHMDQMGEVEYAPGEPKGTPWHPHRGFETVTYMIDGTFQHQDSIGGGGLITNGATQWMTAGSGILHIERPPEQLIATGGLFHGIQLWVNLPAAEKMVDPRYQDLEAQDIDAAHLPRRRRAGAGHRRRGRRATVGPGRPTPRSPWCTPPCSRARSSSCPGPAEFNALVYVLVGQWHRSALEGRPIHTGQLVVHGAGDAIVLRADQVQEARHPALDVLILGGRPIREPVAAHGPFVMNTREELIQAFEDYEAGRLGTVPADHIGHA